MECWQWTQNTKTQPQLSLDVIVCQCRAFTSVQIWHQKYDLLAFRFQKPFKLGFCLQPLFAHLWILCHIKWCWLNLIFSYIFYTFALKLQIWCQVSLCSNRWIPLEEKISGYLNFLKRWAQKDCNLIWDFNVIWNLSQKTHQINPY